MQRRSLSSTSFIRTYNAAAILRMLYEKGVCTRAELTRATKISPATVSRIVTQLIKAGIVRAETRAASSGGRRPALLHIDRTKLHVAGVELRQDQVAMILVNLRGEAIRREVFSPPTLHPERLVAELVRRISTLVEGIDRGSILGVGFAVAGVVERERGTIVRLSARSIWAGTIYPSRPLWKLNSTCRYKWRTTPMPPPWPKSGSDSWRGRPT